MGMRRLGHKFGAAEIVKTDDWLHSMPLSKKPWIEPVKEEFFLTRNGLQVLRKWREKITEPLQRETFPGRIEINLTRISPCKDVRAFLEKEGILNGPETEEFIMLLRNSFEANRRFIEDALRDGKGDLKESFHPLVAFFRPNDDGEVMETVTYSITALFSPKKDALLKFLKDYRKEVMTVKVVRSFRVIRTGASA